MGNWLYLDECRLTDNVTEGLFSESGGGFNSVTFGSSGMDPAGYNSITNNGSVQIRLDGGILNGGSSGYNDENDIGHISPAIPRVQVDGGATAYVTQNYWLTPTPDPSMFVVNSGQCHWNPYLQQSSIPGELQCFTFYKSAGSMALGPVDLTNIAAYAVDGRMNEVYTFVNNRLASAVGTQDRVDVLKALVATEVTHAREFPDSVAAVVNRCTGFLQQQASSIRTMPAAYVALRAELFAWLGMPDSAGVEYTTLAQSYGASSEYISTLPSKLINAFNKRDSAAIDNTIAEMVTARCDHNTIRNAHSERRAHYRCKKNRIIPKHAERTSPEIPLPDEVRVTVTPNPAMSEATIICDISECSTLEVKLYRVDGKEVRTLYSGRHDAGLLAITEKIQDLNPGMYLCRILSKNYIGSARFVIIR